VKVFDAVWPPEVIVKATRTDAAGSGTVKEHRATPANERLRVMWGGRGTTRA
jgi:hypothetical protein